MSRVLVTGANGFIGRHLVQQLAAAGHSVDGVVRRGGDAPPQLDTVWRSQGLIAADLAGVDAVMHLAGLAHAGARGADRAALFNVNVDQTVNLYRQAVAAGVPRFIWLSSIKVLGDVSSAPLPPEADYRPGDDYAVSKVAAEQQLREDYAADTQLCIVRPPLVYGPGVQANFYAMLRHATGPWPLPLAAARAPRAWLSVHNLVSLLLALLAAEDLPQPVAWHVRDAEETPVTDMLTDIARAAGVPLRQWPLPPPLALAGAALLGKRAAARRLFLPLQVDMSDTQRLLGWQPPMPQSSAIKELVQWYLTR